MSCMVYRGALIRVDRSSCGGTFRRASINFGALADDLFTARDERRLLPSDFGRCQLMDFGISVFHNRIIPHHLDWKRILSAFLHGASGAALWRDFQRQPGRPDRWQTFAQPALQRTSLGPAVPSAPFPQASPYVGIGVEQRRSRGA